MFYTTEENLQLAFKDKHRTSRRGITCHGQLPNWALTPPMTRVFFEEIPQFVKGTEKQNGTIYSMV